MRSERSSNQLWTIIKNDLKRFWALPAVSFIILFLSGPFVMINRGKDLYTYGSATIPAFSDNINAGFILVMVLLGFGAGILICNYMVNKRAANYVYSLPVKRNGLLTANIITGLIMIAVPFAVNAALMVAIDSLSGAVSYLEMLAIQILITMVIFAFTILAATVSGNILMHIFTAAFFNGIAPMAVILVLSYMRLLLDGFDMDSQVTNVLMYTTALTALVGSPKSISVCVYIIVLIILIAISYVLNGRRKADNIGESMIFRSGKYLMLGVVVFLGAGIGGILLDAIVDDFQSGIHPGLVWGLVFGFVLCFVVMSILIEKSTRIFKRGNLLTGGIVAGLIIVLVGGLAIDVTGYASKAPVSSDTEYAYTRLDTSFALSMNRFDAGIFQVKSMDISDGKLLMMKDKENIEAACKIQKILSQRKTRSDMEGRFAICLVSKGGRKMVRAYDDLTEETIKKMEPYLKKIFESAEVKKGYSLSNLKLKINEMTYSDDEYLADDEYTDGASKNIDNKYFDGLIKALDDDFADMTYEGLKKYWIEPNETEMNNAQNIVISLGDEDYEHEITIRLDNSQKKTMDYLRKINVL